MNLHDKLQEKRPAIIWAETAAILHDIGKLSKKFIEYRQTWRTIENGYDEDPHDHEFLKNDDLINSFVEAKKWLQAPVEFSLNADWEKEAISVADAVNQHIKPGNSLFLNMLKSADAKDAAVDRNNPFFSAEQDGDIFKTDIFGVETEFDIQSLETHRRQLYDFLNQQHDTLPDGQKDFSFTARKTLLDKIRVYFDEGFSDTTRPDNDTTLWEHCYAVASIFKVILLHYLIYDERLDQFDKIRFGIFGVGWDGLAYLSHGHKIGDIVGRKACIDEFRQEIKETVEHNYLIGNTIYEDDNGIFFLVPILPCEIDLDKTDFDRLGDYGKLLKNIQEKIIDISIDRTCGELLPKFHLIQDTKHITHLVRCITVLSNKLAYPIINPSKKMSDRLSTEWKTAGPVQVCPVCQRRPVKEDWDICAGCIDVRKKAVGNKEPKSGTDIEDTVFISEIISTNKDKPPKKRAALIVAKIGLKDWLNGRLIRSLFVSEAKGLEKELAELGQTKHFETIENEIKERLTYSDFGNLIQKDYDYHRICEEIDRCYLYDHCKDKKEMEYAENTVFLYDRRNLMSRNPGDVHAAWTDLRDSAMEEYIKDADPTDLLYNLLCAKTPTPSTVLDIWNTTQKFFAEFKKGKDEKRLDLALKKRWTADIEKPEKAIVRAAYDGMVGNSSVEVVWMPEKNNRVWIIGDIDSEIENGVREITLQKKLFGQGDGKLRLIINNPNKSVPYFPCRIITATPDMFVAIVPADDALDISQMIYDGYLKKFGKVIGRLPISIGNIFFKAQMPMYVVLDAGRRMLQNFENLHRQWAGFVVDKNQLPTCPTDRSVSLSIAQVNLANSIRVATNVKWEIPCRLGNDETDYYHPYVFVEPRGKVYSHRKNYFRTVMGDVIHCTEIAPGDIMRLIPNYYDFEFLDSNTRRHELSMGEFVRRKSNVADFNSKPILLDELKQKIMKLWQLFENDTMLRDLTDSKLRNMQSLWLTKYQQWQVNLEDRHSKSYTNWIQLVKSSLSKELKEAENCHAFLIETIESGLFFDALELHMGILKKKIDKKGGR